MGKLLERLQASVTHGKITDVVEEWLCKHGEIGVYGAEEDSKRVFVAAIRNGDTVKANKYTHLEIQNVLTMIRSIAEVCGARKAKLSVLSQKADPGPVIATEEAVASFQDEMP